MASLLEWNRKLWQACLDGELFAVNEALKKGADLNWENPDNELYTSLHVAIHCEHEEIVKVLLEHGADPNTISEDEYSPLITACEKESTVFVELLLEHDAKPDLAGTIESALHVAVASDNKKIVELLLNANAAIIDKKKESETPLITAARNGHTDMVRYLISKKANIDLKDKMGYTALHHAAMHNRPAVFELLLNKGANPDTLSKSGFSPLISAAKIGSREIVQQLIQWSSLNGEKIDLLQDGPEGNSALHYASDQAQLEVVKLLVNGGSRDKLNQDGDTPLHLASRRGHVHVIELLLKHGAKSIRNKEGKTPAELAEENNHPMAKSRLQKSQFTKQHSLKFKPEVPQSHSQLSIDEALWNACYENKEDQIRKILSQGANQNWRNKQHNNFSCLDIAVFSNHTGVEKILLESADEAKGSALHLAASYGRAEAAESLISAGADVDACDEKTGNTPLHNAATYGHLDTVKLLIQKGALLKKRNRKQLTPLGVAEIKKRVDVIKYLEERESQNPGSLLLPATATGFEAAFKAEMKKREQLEAELQQLKAEKEREASDFQKHISDLKDMLEQKEKELVIFRSKAISVPSAETCPEIKDLIQLKMNNGSQLRIIDFILSHPEDLCTDFAHMLLSDSTKVRRLTESHKQKERLVRAVLESWTSNANRSWSDLIEAMSGAGLEERTVKALRENFS